MASFDNETKEAKVSANTSMGAFAKNLPESEGRNTFYVTTAIAYMNGIPHIGHAYEFMTADAIARLHRFMGEDTFFVTGADEHGQKVEASAEKRGLAPLEHCNEYVAAFDVLNKRLCISIDDYVRTTEERHKKICKQLWNMCAQSDDIYLQAYDGWYNEREECYVTESDAAATEYKDPDSGVEYKRVSEETYFFKMSKYADRLIAHIEENPSFIEPASSKNEIIARLTAPDGLHDVCISRTTFTWGIPVPEGFDEKHIMYVWFDALTNYLTGVDGLNPDSELSRYWPANCHVIGKDIKWFHTVIWPTMLMSAGVALPKQIFAHGFVNAADGRKMSKSYHNTIDPNEVLEKYPLDTVRYYVMTASTYGSDLNFNTEALVTMHNSELADVLGNLVHRSLSLCHKYCEGVVPDVKHDPAFSLPFDMASLIEDTDGIANTCGLNVLAYRAMETIRNTNKFLTEAEPWKMKGEDEGRRINVVRTTMEAIYAAAHWLAPVMPQVAEKIFEKLNTQPKAIFNLKSDFYNLVPGTAVTVGDILFCKIDLDGNPVDEKARAKEKAAAGAKAAISKKKAAVEDPNQPNFTKIEIRVGIIQKVWNHDSADKLYCEEVDLGPELGIREIASGLRNNYTLDEMLGKRVLVVCNLKPAKMVGFESCGMLLAAKSTIMTATEDGDGGGDKGDKVDKVDKVELLSPPEGAELGERVFCAGLEGEPWPPNKMDKKKMFAKVAVDLRTNEEGVACWEGQPLLTSAGPCSAYLTHSPIS